MTGPQLVCCSCGGGPVLRMQPPICLSCDPELDKAASELWRKENPDDSVFKITPETKTRYALRVLYPERQGNLRHTGECMALLALVAEDVKKFGAPARDKLIELRNRLNAILPEPTPTETVSRMQREMGERCPRLRGDDCVYPECTCDRAP